eukprot:GHVN01050407.1.p1 GENE.GHVN01050407.1~~GHVN01050407.1.p1  ORF type:complete len:1292 (-),score=247.12 GHVN01050407.1:94-3969(-)
MGDSSERQRLCQMLTASVGYDQAARDEALKQLDGLEKTHSDALSLTLLSIYKDPLVDSIVRKLAVICLKNCIIRNWKFAEGHRSCVMSESVKTQIKSEVLAVVPVLHQLGHQEQVGELIRRISRFDFPQKWTELVPVVFESTNGIESYISAPSGDPSPHFIPLYILHQVFKETTTRRITGRSPAQLGESLLPTINSLWAVDASRYVTVAVKGGDSAQWVSSCGSEQFKVSRYLHGLGLIILTRCLPRFTLHTHALKSSVEIPVRLISALRGPLCAGTQMGELSKAWLRRLERDQAFAKMVKVNLKWLTPLLKSNPLAFALPGVLDETFTSALQLMRVSRSEIGRLIASEEMSETGECFQWLTEHSVHLITAVIQDKQITTPPAPQTETGDSIEVHSLTTSLHNQFTQAVERAGGVLTIVEQIVSNCLLMTPSDVMRWNDDGGEVDAQFDLTQTARQSLRVLQSRFDTIMTDHLFVSLERTIESYIQHPNDQDCALRCESVLSWALAVVSWMDIHDNEEPQLLDSIDPEVKPPPLKLQRVVLCVKRLVDSPHLLTPLVYARGGELFNAAISVRPHLWTHSLDQLVHILSELGSRTQHPAVRLTMMKGIKNLFSATSDNPVWSALAKPISQQVLSLLADVKTPDAQWHCLMVIQNFLRAELTSDSGETLAKQQEGLEYDNDNGNAPEGLNTVKWSGEHLQVLSRIWSQQAGESLTKFGVIEVVMGLVSLTRSADTPEALKRRKVSMESITDVIGFAVKIIVECFARYDSVCAHTGPTTPGAPSIPPTSLSAAASLTSSAIASAVSDGLVLGEQLTDNACALWLTLLRTLPLPTCDTGSQTCTHPAYQQTASLFPLCCRHACRLLQSPALSNHSNVSTNLPNSAQGDGPPSPPDLPTAIEVIPDLILDHLVLFCLVHGRRRAGMHKAGYVGWTGGGMDCQAPGIPVELLATIDGIDGKCGLHVVAEVGRLCCLQNKYPKLHDVGGRIMTIVMALDNALISNQCYASQLGITSIIPHMVNRVIEQGDAAPALTDGDISVLSAFTTRHPQQLSELVKPMGHEQQLRFVVSFLWTFQFCRQPFIRSSILSCSALVLSCVECKEGLQLPSGEDPHPTLLHRAVSHLVDKVIVLSQQVGLSDPSEGEEGASQGGDPLSQQSRRQKKGTDSLHVFKFMEIKEFFVQSHKGSRDTPLKSAPPPQRRRYLYRYALTSPTQALGPNGQMQEVPVDFVSNEPDVLNVVASSLVLVSRVLQRLSDVGGDTSPEARAVVGCVQSCCGGKPGAMQAFQAAERQVKQV